MTALTSPTVRVRRRKHKVDMGSLRQQVFERDGVCIGYLFDQTHICADLAGSHSPYNLDRMTLGHVKGELRMGVRADSDPAHCVTECLKLNTKPPSKAEREFERAYLARLYGLPPKPDPSKLDERQ